MADRIVLRSTPKGFASCYFWSAVWAVVFLAVGLWLSGCIDSIYQAAHVNSYAEFSKLGYKARQYSELMDPPLIHFGMYLSYVIAAVFALVGFLEPFYGAREINTFLNNKAERLGKVVCETYSFPFSKNVIEALFDRIITIQVEQSGFDRLLDTGTLNVEFVTFTNADSNTEWWFVPAVEKPHERKAELEAAMTDHEGLLVKMSRDGAERQTA